MSEMMGGMGIVGSLIFIVLIFMIPISIYAAQKWAYKCYRELQKMNETVASINDELTDLKFRLDKSD